MVGLEQKQRWEWNRPESSLLSYIHPCPLFCNGHYPLDNDCRFLHLLHSDRTVLIKWAVMAAAPASAQGAVALLGTCDPQQAAPASDLLFYVAEYEVLVCKEHGGVRNWNSHLRDHHSTDSKMRRALKHKYDHLKLQNPRNVRLPPPLGPPFLILGVLLDAFICEEEECSYISISWPGIA